MAHLGTQAAETRWRWRHVIPVHSRTGLAPSTLRQRGTFALMSVGVMGVLLALCGLATDVGMIYNRKAELQGVSQTAAIAAARKLDGTGSGVSAARDAARDVVRNLKVRYGIRAGWDDAALAFSASPSSSADWVGIDTAKAAPSAMFFVKVDTRGLDREIGEVQTFFMRILSNADEKVYVHDQAVAGRSTINITPLAICAMSPDAGAPRTNPGPPPTVELVEHGFRRGVAYNLMQLNPNGTSPVSYAVDPLAAPGALGSPSNTSASALAQFVCAGKMWVPRVTGGGIRVRSSFPIGSLYQQLNSRFDQYPDRLCSPYGAPPDHNIRAFGPGPSGGAGWMSPLPSVPSAQGTTSRGRLETIADLPAPPVGAGPDMYGPLWTFTRAVKFSSWAPGTPEPTNGYAKFAPSDWKSLYATVPPPSGSAYPNSMSPYMSPSLYHAPPSADNLLHAARNRRVLNIPLLACPVPAGANVAASVLAIGRFFMTVPATPTALHAEFLGLASESSLFGDVVLYP